MTVTFSVFMQKTPVRKVVSPKPSGLQTPALSLDETYLPAVIDSFPLHFIGRVSVHDAIYK